MLRSGVSLLRLHLIRQSLLSRMPACIVFSSNINIWRKTKDKFQPRACGESCHCDGITSLLHWLVVGLHATERKPYTQLKILVANLKTNVRSYPKSLLAHRSLNRVWSTTKKETWGEGGGWIDHRYLQVCHHITRYISHGQQVLKGQQVFLSEIWLRYKNYGCLAVFPAACVCVASCVCSSYDYECVCVCVSVIWLADWNGR